MRIIIKTPTLAEVVDATEQELASLKKELTYKNTSVQFLLSKHLSNYWLKDKRFHYWMDRKRELESQLETCLLSEDNTLKSGYIPYIKTKISEVVNLIDYPKAKPLPWKSPLEFELYPYQKESIEQLIKAKHASVSLATGMGKSAIILMLAKELGLKTIVVTPSKSIFNELLNEFTKRLGSKYVGGYGDGKKKIDKLITICIAKSLTNLEEGTKEYDHFNSADVVIGDEAHTLAAETLEKVFHGSLINVPYRFFLSATVVRGDGTDKLLHSIVGPTVVDKDICYGIENGYLCPLKFKVLTVPPTEHPKQESKKNKIQKDPLECKRYYYLYNPNISQTCAKIANAMWNVKNQSTLILVEELVQIQMLLKHITVPVGYVHSASKKEAKEFNLDQVKLQEQVDAFNNGEIKVLIGTRSISTGTNMYPTHNTINWMGGSSEIITKQGAMGRSTRKLEITKFAPLHQPKPYTQVWDFKVEEINILNSQLKKRISYYEETGEKVEIL